MESPTDVSFSPHGQHFYVAGSQTNHVIHVFDMTIPGNDSTVLRLGKNHRSTDGQKGLVSAIAFSSHSSRTLRCWHVCTTRIHVYVYDEQLPFGNPAGSVLQVSVWWDVDRHDASDRGDD